MTEICKRETMSETLGTKLNSIENIISKAIINNEMSHEEFTIIVNEEKNYHELKRRMMKCQKGTIKRNKLIEEWDLKALVQAQRRAEST